MSQKTILHRNLRHACEQIFLYYTQANEDGEFSKLLLDHFIKMYCVENPTDERNLKKFIELKDRIYNLIMELK